MTSRLNKQTLNNQAYLFTRILFDALLQLSPTVIPIKTDLLWFYSIGQQTLHSFKEHLKSTKAHTHTHVHLLVVLRVRQLSSTYKTHAQFLQWPAKTSNDILCLMGSILLLGFFATWFQTRDLHHAQNIIELVVVLCVDTLRRLSLSPSLRPDYILT